MSAVQAISEHNDKRSVYHGVSTHEDLLRMCEKIFDIGLYDCILVCSLVTKIDIK